MAQTIKLKRSATAGGAPTTSQLELGEVAINTYDGKMYIKKSVAGTESIVEISGGDSGTGIIDEFLYTATAGQTAFSGNDDNSDFLSYVTGAIQVFLNGILLDPETDYTATNGALITLVSAAAVNDYLQIFSFKKKISDGNVTVDSFSGNNSTTAFTLSIDPGDENNTRVFVDGVYQSKANYTVSGTTLTFSTAPPSGTAIEVESGNRSVTLPTTENLDFPDNVKLRLGTSQDLEIYHDGSHSRIKDTGTGNLIVNTQAFRVNGADDAEGMIKATQDGNVELYYNGSKKFETTSTGVDVTGNIVVSGTVDGRDVASDGAAAVAALPRTGGAMTGAITTNSTFDGRDVATDGAKLDGIESGATADQTQSEINALGITATGLSGTPAISVANITTTGELRGPASLVIDPAAVGDNTGTVVIKGNLQVDGATTTINSTTLTVDDLNLTLASGAANGTAANGAGITVDGASATLTYQSTGDNWAFNKNLDVTGNITLAEYLYHSGNTGTNLRFLTDRAILTSGGGAGIDAHNNGNLYLTGTTIVGYGNYTSTGTISSGAITSSGLLTLNDNYAMINAGTTSNTTLEPVLWARSQIGASVVQMNVQGDEWQFGGGGTLDTTPILKLKYGTNAATFAGDVGMVTGHSSGKFAVMSSSVHGSYDFYNNGTSYFNGSVTVDDVLNVTGTNKAIQMNGVTRINGVGDIIGTSYYVGANAVIDTSRNITAGTISSGAITSSDKVQADYFKATSNIPSETSANTGYFDVFGGFTRIISKGADGSTLGGFSILQQASDSSPSATALSIDTSSNATFAGTISSGAITSSGSITATDSILNTGSTTVSTILRGGDGNSKNLVFQKTTGSTQQAKISAVGDDLRFTTGTTEAMRINSDGSIDLAATTTSSGQSLFATGAYASSQGDNRTHFGYNTGSSYYNYIRGANTIISGLSQFDGASTFNYPATFTAGNRPVVINGGAITMQGETGGWAFGLHCIGSSNTNHGGFGFLGGDDAFSYYYIGEAYNAANNFRFYKNGTLQVGGTTILDSSRNLTNIGSISSGSITSSGSLLMTAEGSTNIKTRFIMGKASGNTNNGQLYLNYAVGDNVYIGAGGGGAGLIVAGAITSSGHVQAPTLSVNHTGALSGTQVYIKRVDANTNLMRWGEGTSGQDTYRFRLDQNFQFIGNSGSGDNIILNSANGNIRGTSFNVGNTAIIDSSGNLTNIGTATLSSTTSTLLTLNPTANNYGGISFQYGGVSKGFSGYNSGFMVFGGEASTDTRLQAGGQYGLSISNSSRNVSIGSTSTHPEKLYVNGNIRADGAYYVGGLAVIDSSRNISAGASITIDGDSADPYLYIDGSTNSRDSGVKINAGGGYRTALRMDVGNNLYIHNNTIHINSSGVTTLANNNNAYNLKVMGGSSNSWFGVYDDANDSANILVTRSNSVDSFRHLGHTGETTIKATGTGLRIESTNDEALQLVGSGTGLNFTSGTNNRIYFAGKRALEGNSAGTSLQIGEGYTNLYLQGNAVIYGHLTPSANNTHDLGSSTMVWRDLYIGDLNLNNETRKNDDGTTGNEIDGTTGNWTVQEGEEHLYLINNKNGKKYKFALEEIE